MHSVSTKVFFGVGTRRIRSRPHFLSDITLQTSRASLVSRGFSFDFFPLYRIYNSVYTKYLWQNMGFCWSFRRSLTMKWFHVVVKGIGVFFLLYLSFDAGADPIVREYYNPSLDHYFITADPREIQDLENGTHPGWTATGVSFPVWSNTLFVPVRGSYVCRFYGRPEFGLDSHFYSASPTECAAITQRFAPMWQLESTAVFAVALPDSVTGECPYLSETPIYRLWNQRPDSNHRYVTNLSVRQQMIERGWLPEGYGPLGVVMCATSGLTYQASGFDLGLYIGPGKDPNLGDHQISDKELQARIKEISFYTRSIRTYGCNDDLRNAGMYAHLLGLKAAVGAWISKDLAENERQIACVISVAQAKQADLVIIGSEVLLRGDLPLAQLLSYLQRIKQAVPTVPVTTADTYGMIIANPTIIDSLDVVMVNIYPYWEGIPVDQALASLHSSYKQVTSIAKGKKVIVSETGWPSEGDTIGRAIPSFDNANFYFLNFVSWARANNVEYYYFEFWDEKWKARYGRPQEGSFGVLYESGIFKLFTGNVFYGEIIPDNWSVIPFPGGPGQLSFTLSHIPPLGSFENLEGDVLHVSPSGLGVAAYIKVGAGWWTKPYWASPVTPIQRNGHFVVDITTGGTDNEATEIVVFLVKDGYNPPLMYGNLSLLPAELYQNAITYIVISR